MSFMGCRSVHIEMKHGVCGGLSHQNPTLNLQDAELEKLYSKTSKGVTTN